MGFRVLNNSLASNPVVGLRGGFNDRQNLERVKADGARQDDQLDNVDPALTAFKTGNKGLVASEPIRPAECHLSLASDCFRHASHTFCDVASG